MFLLFLNNEFSKCQNPKGNCFTDKKTERCLMKLKHTRFEF